MQLLTFPLALPGSAPNAHLTVYLQDTPAGLMVQTRPLVLVCPGGGYSMVSPRESELLAMPFLTMGCHAAVLTYSVAPARWPAALTELAHSVALVRAKAGEWGVDPARLFVLGCSAGGHLAACLGVFWHQPWLVQAVGAADRQVLRPTGLILCYPVITSGEHRNIGSLEALLGDAPDPALWRMLSLETQVTAQTPPSFVWHTFDDACVPAENALLWATACKAANVNCELHLYRHGAHGLSRCNRQTAGADGYGVEPACESWLPLAQTWLKSFA